MKLSEIELVDSTNVTPIGNITLIGMVEDGPVRHPFTVNENVDIYTLLGKNQLSCAYNALEASGISRDRIHIYRLNGIHGTFSLLDSDNHAYITFKTIGASDDDRFLSVEFGYQSLLIKKTNYDRTKVDENGVFNEISSITSRSYTYSDYTYLSELVDDINHDAELGIVEVVVQELQSGKIKDYFKNKNEYFFMNSNSEDNYILTEYTDIPSHVNNYMSKLNMGIYEDGEFESASQLINTELMYFTDCYFDMDERFGYITGLFATEKTEREESQIFSLLSTSPVPSKDVPPEWYYLIEGNRWMGENGEVIINPDKSMFEYLSKLQSKSVSVSQNEKVSKNLQVTVGDTFDEEYKMPITAYYAATYLNTPYYQPVSNKQLMNDSFGEEISKTSIAILQQSGYICCVPSIRKNYIPFGAQTFLSKEKGTLSHLHNQRFVSYLSSELKASLLPYIGSNKPINYEHQIILNDLTAVLEKYSSNNLIQSFNISFPNEITERDTLEIDISIQLYSELKKVNGTFSLESRRGVVSEWTV